MNLFSVASLLVLFLSSAATLSASAAPRPAAVLVATTVDMTIADLISQRKDLEYLKNLTNAAADAELLANLLADNTKSFTVFAPHNNVVDNNDDRYLVAAARITMDSHTANRTAFYHVIEGTKILRSSDFSGQAYCPMLEGVALEVFSLSVPPKYIAQTCINFGQGSHWATIQDGKSIEASNGVIHFIDRVLVPREDTKCDRVPIPACCPGLPASPIQMSVPPPKATTTTTTATSSSTSKQEPLPPLKSLKTKLPPPSDSAAEFA